MNSKWGKTCSALVVLWIGIMLSPKHPYWNITPTFCREDNEDILIKIIRRRRTLSIAPVLHKEGTHSAWGGKDKLGHQDCVSMLVWLCEILSLSWMLWCCDFSFRRWRKTLTGKTHAVRLGLNKNPIHMQGSGPGSNRIQGEFKGMDRNPRANLTGPVLVVTVPSG